MSETPEPMMPHFRLSLLALPLLLLGWLQLLTTSGVISGPYNGSFLPGGLGLKKPLSPEESTLQGGHPWSIYCWVKSDSVSPESTLLAGFGEPGERAGAQRFFAVRGERVSFWAGGAEISTGAQATSGKWQFLAATFDGGELSLYVDGLKSAAGKMQLTTAAPVILLAPATQVILRRAVSHARVLPAYGSDNFVSLLPGERRRIDVEVPAAAGEAAFQVELKGWNVRGVTVPVERTR